MSQQHMQITKRAYISASSPKRIVVSGPGATIEQLRTFPPLSDVATSRQEPYQPYHAPFLYREEHARDIIHSVKAEVLELLETHQQCIPLVTSTLTSNVQQQQQSMLTTFEDVINEILHVQLNITSMSEGIAGLTEKSYSNASRMIDCGSTQWQPELLTSLRKATKADFEFIEHCENKVSSSSKQRTTRNPQLAIVGMAGRFPDAADHEKFWTLLEAGLDVHREVSIHADRLFLS